MQRAVQPSGQPGVQLAEQREEPHAVQQAVQPAVKLAAQAEQPAVELAQLAAELEADLIRQCWRCR
ncbi:MAG: hypothetical protein CMO28_18045 [Tistrella sp.]|nr:hypothetical protein [Tistrella sp.]